MSEEPIVTDGEPNLGPNATLWHEVFRTIERVTKYPLPPDTVRFEATEIRDGPTVYVEYDAETLQEEWGGPLHESPHDAEQTNEE